MNFLSEVLTSAEETDVERCKEKIPNIIKQIESYKKEIECRMNDIYQEFREWPQKNQVLLDGATQLGDEVNNLQNRIEDITMKEVGSKVKELNGLAEDLERSNVALGIITNLIRANELFVTFQDLFDSKEYLKAVRELLVLIEYLDRIPEDEVTDAVTSMKLCVSLKRDDLVKAVTDVFDKNIKVYRGKSGTLQANSIKIKECNEEFLDSLLVLKLCNKEEAAFNNFSKFLIMHICKPIITCVTQINIDNRDGFYVLNVAIKKSSSKVPYREVFAKLLESFNFLQNALNYTIEGDRKVIRIIGDQIKNDLAKIIVKECLNDAMPSSSSNKSGDAKLFKNIIEDTRIFQNALTDIDLLSRDSNPILDFAKEMDLLLVNKKCHEYLSTAIGYMKKDLHNMVNVGVRKEPGSPLSVDEFPESSVSKSTIDILELAQKALQEAENESDFMAGRLICTIQSMFYQYGNIVCGHHERLLQTIPQQVALFRNNCMYIAHQLSQMNETYTKFSLAALPSPPLFTDQAHQLKTVGGEVFLAYVETQVQVMETVLLENEFTSAHIAQVLHPDSDKCIRQCMRQYEILRTVWFNVLPISVYNKTVGYLLNMFCKKLVEVVLACEDIPFKNAEMLIDIYKVVLTRGPKLFTDPQETCLFVEVWQKLKDLVFILGARMVDIADRWAEGKGPLTLTFTADEVRKLIKALFQNTDRRAAVLNKIHN